MGEIASAGRRRWLPGAAHLGIALLALALIVPLALSAAQPSPPAIAEFAPQVQSIKQVPSEQPGSIGGIGNSPGASGTGAATSTPTPSPTPSGGVPSLPANATFHPCVGSPPRQTEDPQSPPCVPYWTPTDNGGATAFGVTAHTITIAVPQFFFGDNTADTDLVKFFNKRYEFYGRQLVMKGYTPQGNLSAPPDPQKEQSDAKTVQGLQAFASTGTGFRQGSEFLYYDDLAREHIISAGSGLSARQTSAHFSQYAPYEWGFQNPIDQSMRNWGEFICKQLVGHPAAYAGSGQQLTSTNRVFAELIERPADGSIPDDSLLLDALSNCGAGAVRQQRYEIDEAGDVSTQARNALINMANAHVTSVICTCNNNDLNATFMQDATSQGYQPEWVVQSYSGNDLEDSTGSSTPDQKLHEFGISFLNKLQPEANAPWYWAVHEADPTYAVPATDGYNDGSLYQSLLILASGIQAAGPHLTPDTFAQALQGLHYPNPGCGRAPYYQACVGFDGGFTMVSSASMIWHDPRQPGTIDPSGHTAVCYVDSGRRYVLGSWPTEPARFYGSTCR